MHYLNELIPVLKELEQTYDFTFLVISNEKPTFELRSLQFIKWQKETEIVDLAKMNIGVMPLQKDIWSKGKCGFKGLQYMALEIPTIMSPVGVNTTIVQDGINGFIASSLEEWKEKLILLLTDKELRNILGKAGRKTVEERYSVKANQQNYLNLLN
jgi:glycosyltransferase involved in cell wall biosynthesis